MGPGGDGTITNTLFFLLYIAIALVSSYLKGTVMSCPLRLYWCSLQV